MLLILLESIMMQSKHWLHTNPLRKPVMILPLSLWTYSSHQSHSLSLTIFTILFHIFWDEKSTEETGTQWRYRAAQQFSSSFSFVPYSVHSIGIFSTTTQKSFLSTNNQRRETIYFPHILLHIHLHEFHWPLHSQLFQTEFLSCTFSHTDPSLLLPSLFWSANFSTSFSSSVQDHPNNFSPSTDPWGTQVISPFRTWHFIPILSPVFKLTWDFSSFIHGRFAFLRVSVEWP